MVTKLERNVRLYRAHERGVSLSSLANFERLTPTRVYQIITATKYQLDNGNPLYVEEYERGHRHE